VIEEPVMEENDTSEEQRSQKQQGSQELEQPK